jgi:hypothetical protein
MTQCTAMLTHSLCPGTQTVVTTKGDFFTVARGERDALSDGEKSAVEKACSFKQKNAASSKDVCGKDPHNEGQQHYKARLRSCLLDDWLAGRLFCHTTNFSRGYVVRSHAPCLTMSFRLGFQVFPRIQGIILRPPPTLVIT